MASSAFLAGPLLRGVSRACPSLVPKATAFARGSRSNVVPSCFAPSAVLSRTFSDLVFAKTHEWIKQEEEGVAYLGISDFAQSQLGEVVYCDLPAEGATFAAKETIATLESVKAVGEVYAPSDCVVLEANENLNDDPALVNSSSEGDGWLVKIKYTGQLSMLDRPAYDEHVEGLKEE